MSLWAEKIHGIQRLIALKRSNSSVSIELLTQAILSDGVTPTEIGQLISSDRGILINMGIKVMEG
ncbi:MAG: hypothetical protein F6K50_38240 [Moorea sp. SIO3I7]|uniref:Uncharacterized protein n=1 Tax=Moorena bouillonii PNG TaxID=568701 RepID=A0A1U7MVT6_9CYAN|nr:MULTISPECIES: hypothetical protein [Moorena]NEO01051.1 hypothetical protein [Moorena sp. SIO3I7]NEO13313.1 hypothetical protein [Moorena sp. SIO3E8]NEP99605.1 hypothetical protein [Moorena sp. SIO3F7]OLT57799.1 hypothetical protein BJP37_00805 [Moorena bouillonii PNG]